MPTAPDTSTGPGIYQVNGYTVRFPTFDQTHEGELTQEGWNYQIGGTIEGLTGVGIQIYNYAVSIVQQIPISPPPLPGCAMVNYPFSTLRDYRIRPLSNGVVEFGCIFRGMSPGAGGTNIIKSGSSARQIERNTDVFGRLLKVVAPTSIKTDPKLINELEYVKADQVKTVPAFTPESDIDITRLELGGSPVGDSTLYTSTVNLGPCPWDRSAKPRTWMCMGITQESHDLGITWTRNYRFQYGRVIQPAPALVTGWDVGLAWIDPRTGNAPGDINVPINVGGATTSNEGYQLATQEDFTIFGFLFNF